MITSPSSAPAVHAPPPPPGRGRPRSLLSARWAVLLVLLVGWMGAVLVSGVGGGVGRIVAPLVAVVVIAAVFFSVLLSRSSQFPLDELGTLYGGVVLLYGAIPLIAFAILGTHWLPFRDARLIVIQPTTADVARVGWLYAVYLAGFVAAYLPVRGRASAERVAHPVVPPSLATSAAAVWVVIVVGMLMVPLFFDMHAESYADTYLVVQRLPLLVRQFMLLAGGMRTVVELVLLLWMFGDFSRRKWLLAAWLCVLAVSTITAAGGRAGLMLMLVACMVLYHRGVRPVRVWFVVVAGVTLLASFTALGAYRSYRESRLDTEFTPTFTAGEFEFLFDNALDIQQHQRRGELGDVPLSLYVSDAVAFVPSQFLPFQKVMVSEWYLSRFYPDVQQAGGGFAFGVVPQSLLGFGFPEILLRGLFVGAVFALIHRRYARGRGGVWAMVAYLFLLLVSYQSVRSSTFYPLTPVVQQLVPSILALEAIRFVLRRIAGRPALPALGPAAG